MKEKENKLRDIYPGGHLPSEKALKAMIGLLKAEYYKAMKEIREESLKTEQSSTEVFLERKAWLSSDVEVTPVERKTIYEVKEKSNKSKENSHTIDAHPIRHDTRTNSGS